MSHGSFQKDTSLTAEGATLALRELSGEIVSCRRCPRLVEHRERIGETKRASYRDWDYWAKPVPSFGDPEAPLMLLGLAPAAHGGNRTGRVFTGDASATFLIKAMHEAGLANQPVSDHRDDGLEYHWRLRLRRSPLRPTPRPSHTRGAEDLPSLPGPRNAIAAQPAGCARSGADSLPGRHPRDG